MKLSFKTLSLVALPIIATVPQAALAWGKVGHSTVAEIAEQNLDPAVLIQVRRLLSTDGVRHMSQVSSWADAARKDYVVAHSTRFPLDGSKPREHLCPARAMCADEAVTYYKSILVDRTKPDAEREIALKFIVHLVGDLHQPLHGSDPTGKNLVTLGGSLPMPIHKIWDTVIVRAHGKALGALVRELAKNREEVETGGDARVWAAESGRIARDQIYSTLPVCWDDRAPKCPPIEALPTNYAASKYPIVAKRLKQAGLRLAMLLNKVLADR